MPFDEEELDQHGECAHEIHRLKSELERLQDATAPFLTAAKVIAAHDSSYAPRIVMIGGLSDACDLTKTHFARLLQAVQSN